MSAHGLEGADYTTDWWHWEQRPGRISDGMLSHPAAEHTVRYSQDYGLATQFGLKTLCIALSWARIEPEHGHFNQEAIHQYMHRTQKLLASGICPWVIPVEYTLPAWLGKMGGWACPDMPEIYSNYVTFVVENLNSVCHHWVPLLNPAFMSRMVYQEQVWPGARGNHLQRYWQYTQAVRNQAICAHLAYERIKKLQPDSLVGASVRLDVYEPHDPFSPWDFRACKRYQNSTLKPYFDVKSEVSEAKSSRSFDFILAAVYGRQLVRFNPFYFPDTAVICDRTGKRISADCVVPYPESVGTLLPSLASAGVPIYIMSGLATTNDLDRAAYLVNLWRLIGLYRDQGVALEGFFHHSFLDSFEWHKGYQDRYGLIHLDAKTQARTPNPSAYLQKEIAETGTLRRGSWEKFVCEPGNTGLSTR